MLNIGKIIGKFVKNSSQKEIDRLKSVVKKINDLEPQVKKLSDNDFPVKTSEFKSKIQNGEDLDSLIPEAFACVREAAKRVLSERHYDVQLIGGLVLHNGKIVEEGPGEKIFKSPKAITTKLLVNSSPRLPSVNQ